MHFLKLQVQYGGDINEVVFPTNSDDPTVEELQQHLEKHFNVPVQAQRVMFRGQNLHEKPEGKLRRYGITNASLIRVVGRKQPSPALIRTEVKFIRTGVLTMTNHFL